MDGGIGWCYGSFFRHAVCDLTIFGSCVEIRATHFLTIGFKLLKICKEKVGARLASLLPEGAETWRLAVWE
jgi:hypothetical protein